MREGLVDIVVGELRPEVHPELEVHALHDAPIVIAAGRDHPLVGRRPGIREARFLSVDRRAAGGGTPLRDAWERLFGGLLAESAVECGSITVIGRLLTSSRQLLVRSFATHG